MVIKPVSGEKKNNKVKKYNQKITKQTNKKEVKNDITRITLKLNLLHFPKRRILMS